MHFDWLSPEAAGFKSQAALRIKTKQGLNQEKSSDPATTTQQQEG